VLGVCPCLCSRSARRSSRSGTAASCSVPIARHRYSGRRCWQARRCRSPRTSASCRDGDWVVGLHLRGPYPQIPVQVAGGRFRVLESKRIPFLKVNAARHVDIADQTLTQSLDGARVTGAGAALGSALDDAIVLARGGHHLGAGEHIVTDGLLDVHVFAGLARPDGGQCVPVIARGDGDASILLSSSRRRRSWTMVSCFPVWDSNSLAFPARIVSSGSQRAANSTPGTAETCLTWSLPRPPIPSTATRILSLAAPKARAAPSQGAAPAAMKSLRRIGMPTKLSRHGSPGSAALRAKNREKCRNLSNCVEPDTCHAAMQAPLCPLCMSVSECGEGADGK